MDKGSFQSRFPGELVPTTGWVTRDRDGVPERIPIQGLAFVPRPLPPVIRSDLASDVDRQAFVGLVGEELLSAQSNLSRLEGSVQALPNPSLLEQPFRMREAQLSSKIEDTFATVEELALAESGRAPARQQVVEVVNYLRALEHGLKSDLPLCARLFRELHAKLMEGVRGDEKRPGEFRTIQVCIGDENRGFAGARFVPPPPGEVLQRCISELEKFLNPAPGYGSVPETIRFPSLIEIALAHYQFECIHPFSDGNGRLGRLLIALALCRGKHLTSPLVYVSAFFEQNRQRYYDLLLRVSTHGDWESWVKFFCRAVSTQAADAIVRAEKLRDLRNRYVRVVTEKRASALVVRLVDLLFVHPAVRPPTLAKQLMITVQSAQKHIDRLVKHKILAEATGNAYGRIYLAKGVLKLVEN